MEANCEDLMAYRIIYPNEDAKTQLTDETSRSVVADGDAELTFIVVATNTDGMKSEATMQMVITPELRQLLRIIT